MSESFEIIEGIRLGVAQAGIKKPGKDDVTVIALAAGSTVAGVYTRNAFCAAPVDIARTHMTASDDGAPRYWLINTGNANAGTGKPGHAAALRTCDALAMTVGVEPVQVMPFSTGVIGELLPAEKICGVLAQAVSELAEDNWPRAASAILTTDTRPKLCSRTVNVDGQTIKLTGITKGAGMIRPDMATMLGFVATDAAVPAQLLQSLLSSATAHSFNRITVDGDTSTNDAVVLAATGASGVKLSEDDTPLYHAFADALSSLCLDLAHAIVRDGEGATKFVEVAVEGGESEQACLDVAFTIAHSPLVKTALFASDPNWGRLLAAIGRAGLPDLDVVKVSVFLDQVLIAENGARAQSYTEEQGAAVMAQADITIRVVLGRGDATATVWTTDFSYDYVRINAEYRT